MPCEVFERLRHSGWVEGRKLILIDGEILEMAQAKPPHDRALGLTGNWLGGVFPNTQFWVRIQMGLYFGINTDPLPDLAVVPGTPRTLTQVPTTALLVIEVAESSLAFDTKDKASLYAAAGIQDYWVIDVENRQLHVFRDPQPDATRRYNHWYSKVSLLNPTDSIAPLAAPNNSVSVNDLLP
jgi:Uma2 family endonuclease